MGNQALCCSERNETTSQNNVSFNFDDAKRKKLLAANSHYSNKMQDEDKESRLSTVNPTANSPPLTPNGVNDAQNKSDQHFQSLHLECEQKVENIEADKSSQSKNTAAPYSDSEKKEIIKNGFVSPKRDEKQLLIDFSNLNNDDTPNHHHTENNALINKNEDPQYVENSPNAILSYFQDNRRLLRDKSDTNDFEFNRREYALLGSYYRDGYDVNQYYSLQSNSVIIEKKFRDIKDMQNEVDCTKSFKCCKNLKVFISNAISIKQEECTIFYEMGHFRLKDIMRKGILNEVQVTKIVLNLVQFILLSHSNQVSLKDIQQDQISLSLSTSQGVSGVSLNRYFVQLNNFLVINQAEIRQQHSWQLQVQHVADLFSEYSDLQGFSHSSSLLTFLESINEQIDMLQFLNLLREKYANFMTDTLIDLTEEQISALNNIYLIEQNIEVNFEFYTHLFNNGSQYLNQSQQAAVVNNLNSYIYTNFKNKSKYEYVESCIKLFEVQCAFENLYELEIIYRIYHSLLCVLNLNNQAAIKFLIRALKLCKHSEVILLYQSLIYCLLSLAYIQKQDVNEARNLFIYSNRIYQAHFNNLSHFPRNNFYQILVFAQSLITYKLGYFDTSIKRLVYLEQSDKNGYKLIIEQKYIWFMLGLNKMELDQYQEAEQYFEKTLNLVTCNETRTMSMADFSKANSDVTVDKNVFDILIMNILANSFNKNHDKLEENIDTYQNYNSDYANDSKSVFQILNKILTVIL